MITTLLIIIALCLLFGGDVVLGLLILAVLAVAAIAAIAAVAVAISATGGWPLVVTAAIVGLAGWMYVLWCRHVSDHPRHPKNPDHPWDG